MTEIKQAKGHVNASSDNYQRANFLYQAALTASKTSAQLAHYYGYLSKEVMKKIVGKVHPNLKRTMCSSCNHPLDLKSTGKILPAEGKKRKKKKPKSSEYVKGGSKKDRKTARNKRPNRVRWNCNQCHYRRSLLQRPSHVLAVGQG